MNVTAIIPIREQSTRLPDKNVRPLCGRPLFAWVLDALSETERVERIVVDTDSARIETLVARECPFVEIIRRPATLCGADVVANQLIRVDLAELDGEHFLQTHVTSPLLQPKTFATAIGSYECWHEDGRYDSLVGVSQLSVWLYTIRGEAINHDPHHLRQHQQDVPLYADNSSLYIFSRESFAASGSRVGLRPGLFGTPKLESVDIDDADDFALAEALMQRRLVPA